MFALDEVNENDNIVQVFRFKQDFWVLLPREVALKQLDHRLSKIYINDILFELDEESYKEDDDVTVEFDDNDVENFGINESTEFRWQCEPSTIRLWKV